jgi:hypothetical protein
VKSNRLTYPPDPCTVQFGHLQSGAEPEFKDRRGNKKIVCYFLISSLINFYIFGAYICLEFPFGY